MRPSLQPYLASKSAFTMAPSWSLAAVALTSIADPDLDPLARLDVARPVGASPLGDKAKAPAMLGEPDLDFPRLTVARPVNTVTLYSMPKSTNSLI